VLPRGAPCESRRFALPLLVGTVLGLLQPLTIWLFRLFGP